eukprot:8333270-Karenia_brevis.AAC.1
MKILRHNRTAVQKRKHLLMLPTSEATTTTPLVCQNCEYRPTLSELTKLLDDNSPNSICYFMRGPRAAVIALHNRNEIIRTHNASQASQCKHRIEE